METRTLTGTVLGGRYRVGDRLGEGGMGAVYEALQEGLDRKVALKVLHPHLAADAELRGRFKREAHVVAMLGHPNVVQISDFQTNPNEPPFLVMERLRGENLRDVLKKTPQLAPQRVAYIAMQVLSALEAAHRANVVHRDIKPDNIFLERTSVQADIVKVLDFGVAKLLGAEDSSGKLTRAGLVVGTLAYMSPEQASGDPVDGRADLYALGAVMYVALAGRKPFEGTSTATLLQAIMTQAPVPIAAIRQDVDIALSNIIDRALAKRPTDRFASAAEMAKAMSRFAVAFGAPHEPPSTIRTTEEPAFDPQTTARFTPTTVPPKTSAPKTVSMPAPLSDTVDSESAETRAPSPPTQRSSYHPPIPTAPSQAVTHQPVVMIAPPMKRRKRRHSALLWIVSLALVMVVLGGAGAALFVASH